ncbi:MAG: AraC family transcriptional regulator [Pseudomonadota bacterium]
MIGRCTIMIERCKGMLLPRPTVSAGLVSGFLDYASRRGGDRASLAARAGLEERALDDPDGRLDLDGYVTLLRVAARMTGDPALALHFSEDVGMSQVSIVGLVMEASATMGEAFLQMQRYGRLAADFTDVARGPRFELADGNGKLFLVDRARYPKAVPEMTEIAFGSLTCGPRRFLPQPHVLAVHLTYPAPAYAAEYRRVFRCPVHFDAAWNALELHPGTPGWKVAQAPRYVFGVLAKHADGLLQDMDAAKGMRGRVEALLLPRLHEGGPSVDAIAAQLGCSRQTLFRRLKTEGVTFSEVLDTLRRDMAKIYLDGRSASVNETAYLVGFSDAAAFSRAFKRWTGRSPNDYRTRAIGDPGDLGV